MKEFWWIYSWQQTLLDSFRKWYILCCHAVLVDKPVASRDYLVLLQQSSVIERLLSSQGIYYSFCRLLGTCFSSSFFCVSLRTLLCFSISKEKINKYIQINWVFFCLSSLKKKKSRNKRVTVIYDFWKCKIWHNHFLLFVYNHRRTIDRYQAYNLHLQNSFLLRPQSTFLLPSFCNRHPRD